jgi:hypothetical protein
MKKNLLPLLAVLLIATMIMTGCAHSIDVQACVPPNEPVLGFWYGTWHGIISGFSFIGSLFDSSISVYAVNNNGAWYDFGFVGGFFFILRLITSPFRTKDK